MMTKACFTNEHRQAVEKLCQQRRSGVSALPRRCPARQHDVYVCLGKTPNTSGQTIRPHRRPRPWLPPVGTRLTAEHKGEQCEATIVECPEVPQGRAILFHGEFFRSLTVAYHSVAYHHNTGLAFWHWNGKHVRE